MISCVGGASVHVSEEGQGLTVKQATPFDLDHCSLPGVGSFGFKLSYSLGNHRARQLNSDPSSIALCMHVVDNQNCPFCEVVKI